MKDFSLDIYRELLERFQRKGYEIIAYESYVKANGQKDERTNVKAKGEGTNGEGTKGRKFVILRHDVDARPENSLRTAQIEHAIGAKATYYFRCPERSRIRENHSGIMTEPEIIRAIVQLGHEIGYHYEDMSLCGGDVDKAYEHFKTWLGYFRQYYAVETICMHGAPTSKWDGKDLWKKYDYKSLGIIGEPYLDTDFSDVFYLTDTGRCWDGYKVSVRDKIPEHQDRWTAAGLTFHTTTQLLEAIEADRLPSHIMLTTHPQRWTNEKGLWWKERILQSMKNVVKRMIAR